MKPDIENTLAADHAELDTLLQDVFDRIDAGDAAATYYALDFLWARLAMHIRAEHLRFFPVVREIAAESDRGKSQVPQLLDKLRNDHDYFIRELARAIKALRLVPEFGNTTETLRIVKDLLEDVKARLETHNRIEEDQIYVLAAEISFGPDKVEHLSQAIRKELGRYPQRFASLGAVTVEIAGYVLVGGASSRMGRDKSALEFGGGTLGQLAAAVLQDFTPDVYAVGGSIGGVPSIPDLTLKSHGKAAIVGVRTALSHSRAEWTALLACDLPFVTPELFQLLFKIANSSRDAGAVVPVQPDGKLQPLAAIYQTKTVLPAVEWNLARGMWRLHGIFEHVPTRRVTLEEYSSLPGADRFFINVNTPEEFVAALELSRM